MFDNLSLVYGNRQKNNMYGFFLAIPICHIIVHLLFLKTFTYLQYGFHWSTLGYLHHISMAMFGKIKSRWNSYSTFPNIVKHCLHVCLTPGRDNIGHCVSSSPTVGVTMVYWPAWWRGFLSGCLPSLLTLWLRPAADKHNTAVNLRIEAITHGWINQS